MNDPMTESVAASSISTPLAKGPAPMSHARPKVAATGWYVVALLGLGYSVNFLDRQIINILAQPIKLELHISDAKLGLLTGTAFGLFYSILGLPIARWADKTHRVNLITAALTLWSGLTCLCAFTQSYAQLFLVRLGVGIGEAGGTPPSQSLIADYVPKSQRTAAFSLFNLGLPIGSLLGFLLGGYINDWFGWRTAFLVAGLPGVVIALLVKFTIREPLRGASDAAPPGAQESPSLRDTLRGLWQSKAFVTIQIGSAFSIFSIYVTNTWLPAMFIRLHAFPVHRIGVWLAVCAGVGGALGTLGGGALAATLRAKWHGQADLWLTIISSALTCPMLLITVMTNQIPVALVTMFLFYVFGYVWMGPNSARVQESVPISSRALAVGIMLCVSSIVGLACGPPLVGLLSDVLRPTLGAASLRAALAVASVAGLVSALGYYLALRHIRRNVAAGDLP